MKPNELFLAQDPTFWSNVKLINQRIGYTVRGKNKVDGHHGFRVPSVKDIKNVYISEGLDFNKLVVGNSFTDFGQLIHDYMEWRGDVLFNHFEPNLMNQAEAKDLFYEMKGNLNPSCPLPMNKQSGLKSDHAYLTGLVNMLIERYIGTCPCNYNPGELTAFTQNGIPARTLSRRVDGAFPAVINPTAVWEIKEYYYTTTFGSRIADGVYETQLDGMELLEARKNLGIDVKHYLIIDAHFTWWGMGRSYLCRIIDTMHMGLLSEVIVGKEVLSRIPELAQEWASSTSS